MSDNVRVLPKARYVICLPLAGPIVGFVRRNPRPEGTDDLTEAELASGAVKESGWRRWVWTRDPSQATRWASRLAAENVLAQLAAAPFADVVTMEVEIPR
jgi:hypothetical protein